MSLTIGKPFKGGVIGGVAPVGGDFGAAPIDSRTGAAEAGGDVQAVDTLASFAKTVLAGLGADAAALSTDIPPGTVIAPALA